MVISFAIGTPITGFQIIGAVLVILGVIIASGLVGIQKRNTEKKVPNVI
jgi:drug/metabolite transporter (DMT)-like permease